MLFRSTGDSVTIVTDADIFAEYADVPALLPPLRTELAERVLAMDDETFEAWAGIEASEYEDEMNEGEWQRTGC